MFLPEDFRKEKCIVSCPEYIYIYIFFFKTAVQKNNWAPLVKTSAFVSSLVHRSQSKQAFFSFSLYSYKSYKRRRTMPKLNLSVMLKSNATVTLSATLSGSDLKFITASVLHQTLGVNATALWNGTHVHQIPVGMSFVSTTTEKVTVVSRWTAALMALECAGSCVCSHRGGGISQTARNTSSVQWWQHKCAGKKDASILICQSHVYMLFIGFKTTFWSDNSDLKVWISREWCMWQFGKHVEW